MASYKMIEWNVPCEDKWRAEMGEKALNPSEVDEEAGLSPTEVHANA